MVDEDPIPGSQETVNKFNAGKGNTRDAQKEIKRRHNEDVAEDLAQERNEREHPKD